MTNEAVDAIGGQAMARLNGDQTAEPAAEHEDRPHAQHTPDGEKGNAKPANRISVERPEIPTVGVGRQVSLQQPDHPERCEHPAIAPVLAFARTEVSAAE